MNLQRFEELHMERFIADKPADPRDSSKLMVVLRETGALEHRVFRDIEQYFRAGDVLVLNDSKVFPAKLSGKKETGGKIQILLMEETGPALWTAIASGSKLNSKIIFEGGVTATAVENTGDGKWLLRFDTNDVLGFALAHGIMPLPPYIEKLRRRLGGETSLPLDRTRYQTVYAQNSGSIAAPTAGFHFTPELLQTLTNKGVAIAHVTLHVGWGTFRPMRANSVEEHVMLPEYAVMPEKTADIINSARGEGRRVISVGTTSTRTIESFTDAHGVTAPGAKWADLYIYPPYKFRGIDALVTNFHVPDSTPICLAGSFAGEDLLYKAYGEAAASGYRFYSYGDSMLII